MTKTSRRLYNRLYQIGEGVQEINRNYQKMRLHEPVRIGEIEVTAFPMDHDVVGACGFYIKTPDGTIFYTGDLRFHGLHPERTDESIAKARELGTDVLIIEGTMLWLPDNDGTIIDVPEELASSREQLPGWPLEAELPERLADQLTNSQGVALFNLSLRNIERLLAIVDGARRAGRIAVFEPESAYILLTMTDCREFLVYESDGSTLQFETG